MKNIEFKITEHDMIKYLQCHQKEALFQYREALFIQYMKEINGITSEQLEIIMAKYNFDGRKIRGTYYLKKNPILSSRGCDLVEEPFCQHLSTFSNYLKYYRLDSAGICHLLIPIMKYYGNSKFHFNRLYTNLSIVSDTLVIPMMNPMSVIKSTLEDYRICRKLEIHNQMIYVKMGREQCRREILAYQEIYDDDRIHKIKKIIKGRV